MKQVICIAALFLTGGTVFGADCLSGQCAARAKSVVVRGSAPVRVVSKAVHRERAKVFHFRGRSGGCR